MWSIFICNEKGGDQSYSKENICMGRLWRNCSIFVCGGGYIESVCIIVQPSLWFMTYVPYVSRCDYVYNKTSTVT